VARQLGNIIVVVVVVVVVVVWSWPSSCSSIDDIGQYVKLRSLKQCLVQCQGAQL